MKWQNVCRRASHIRTEDRKYWGIHVALLKCYESNLGAIFHFAIPFPLHAILKDFSDDDDSTLQYVIRKTEHIQTFQIIA